MDHSSTYPIRNLSYMLLRLGYTTHSFKKLEKLKVIFSLWTFGHRLTQLTLKTQPYMRSFRLQVYTALLLGLFSYHLHSGMAGQLSLGRSIHLLPTEVGITFFCLELVFNALLIYGAHKVIEADITIPPVQYIVFDILLTYILYFCLSQKERSEPRKYVCEQELGAPIMYKQKLQLNFFLFRRRNH